MAEDPIIPVEESCEDLSKALAEEKAKAEEYLASLQRSEADFRNYKKRVEQEKQESLAWSNAQLIKSLLPVLDDMERAFSLADSGNIDLTWIDGFRIIQRSLQDILKAHGCTAMECLGTHFDPNLHEAIAHEEGKEGIIIFEQRKGYMMKDKVLRAPLVIVGKGEMPVEKDEQEEQ